MVKHELLSDMRCESCWLLSKHCMCSPTPPGVSSSFRALSGRLHFEPPLDPSFRALSGRLTFTVRRPKFNKDSGSSRSTACAPRRRPRCSLITHPNIAGESCLTGAARSSTYAFTAWCICRRRQRYRQSLLGPVDPSFRDALSLRADVIS